MILRFCVVIPTFDNPATIESVCEDALRETAFPVLVIDDGSAAPVETLLKSAAVREALSAGRLRVLRHDVNRGKGQAIQTAFRDCTARGFTHIVTIDGDGQHYAREIAKVVAQAKKNPWDLVIGHRRMGGETVPSVSKFGRKFSNFWVNYQTGTEVLDSQSGFRAYPLFHVQNMSFRTSKYDFEIEILIRLMWNGVRVHEAEIDVFYPEKNERVSHFHKFWDNARISLLNSVFVVLALLRTHRTPGRMSLAIGVGVFIGCTPLFGFHALIAGAAAFAFRLNAILVFVGTQISIPPIVPFLVIGASKIGEHLMPERGDVVQWLVGTVILGTLLGLAATAISYALFKWSHKTQAGKANWTGKSRGGKFGNGFVKVVLRSMGRRTGYFCLYFIVPYFYLFAPRGRKALNEYWRIMKPSEGFWRRQARVVYHFFRFGTVLMDKIVEAHSGKNVFEVRAMGRENLLTPLAQGKGVILLGVHMGSWDLAASLLKKGELGDQLKVLQFGGGRAVDGSRLDSSQAGRPVFEIHQILSNGGGVILMGDRPLGERLELIPLMGKLAPLDVTPFRIAAATGAPLLFSSAFKVSGTKYDLFAEPPKVYGYEPGRSRDIQLMEWATEFARALEVKMKAYPDQWFNFFRLWSALPSLPDGTKLTTAPARLWEEESGATSPRTATGLGATPTGATRFPV